MKARLISPQGLSATREVQGGREGATTILRLMVGQSLDAATFAELATLAKAVAGTGADATRLARVQAWLQGNVPYVRDPGGFEVLYHPITLLKRVGEGMGGDCDDHASLVAALLVCLGYTCRFKAVARQWPEVFDHVYCQVQQGGEWMTLETILPYAYGREVPGILSFVTVNVQPGEGMQGLLKKVTKTVSKVAQLGVKVLPQVAAVASGAGVVQVLEITKKQMAEKAARQAAQQPTPSPSAPEASAQASAAGAPQTSNTGLLIGGGVAALAAVALLAGRKR